MTARASPHTRERKRERRSWPILLVAVTLWLFTGCVSHIKPYSPKRRPVPQGPWSAAVEEPEPTGSVWAAGATGNFLFTDRRAFQVGDVLTIRIVEQAKALRSAGTELDRESEISAGAEALFGFLAALQQVNPNFDRSKMIGAKFSNSFKGEGKTLRNDMLEATVTAVVREVLPNDNLYVEGQRTILVNQEEHHLYVSGVVRPEDVERDNSVLSSRLAEAQVEFTGRGALTDRTEPGWLTRILDWIWPF